MPVWAPRLLASGQVDPRRNLIHAPDDPSEWPAFREALHRWRESAKARLGYDDALYRRQDLKWAASCYCCCFLMMCDETFYDAGGSEFTVDSFFRHGAREFGVYDAVVLWHAYPRIGIDERNQFDFYRDMPGGLAGLRDLSQAFHARDVRVFLNYNPWDTGTRREAAPDIEVLCELVKAIDADGIFLDTMKEGAGEFRARLDAARAGVALESELALPVERIHDHHMSWAQWFQDSRVPGVLRNKWFERRHMQHQIARWSDDHTAELHTAWMNGSGMMVWENVFGSFAGWSPRDRSMLRLMLPVQRRYASLLSGEAWTPLVETEVPEVYASRWEKQGRRLWTLVNRSDRTVEATLLKAPHTLERCLYYDLIRGRQITPPVEGGQALLAGLIPPRGIGAVVAGGIEYLGAEFLLFLFLQRIAYERADFDPTPPVRKTRLKAAPPAKRRRSGNVPEGMVEIPPAELTLRVQFRVRECGFYESGNELINDRRRVPLDGRHVIERRVKLARYAIDRTPVTNAEFARFLKAAGYRPKYPENFLKHWRNGEPPADKLDHPVVYVDLNDARAYARWAGKRLPAEEEWQYAAQGPDGRGYPWGDRMKPGMCNAGESGTTTSVTAYPGGRSPFGCYDMCGDTWEWTESERNDGRTRFSIIRGGSYYTARGSRWYADGGPRPCEFAAKYLLMWPGLDRCATIGFRCAADVGDC